MPPVSKLTAIAASSLCLVALAASDALAKPKKQKQRAPASSSQALQSRGVSTLSDYERIQREDAWMARASRGGGGGY